MVKFALQIEPQFGFSYEQIRDLAVLCEEAGFHSLWCSDHLFLDERSAERDCWEAWTALAGLSRETSTLRLGTLVTGNAYRYPSILAKIAACVDVMSDGRLEFGFGAGWKEPEYIAYGIPFPSARERVDRFEEALQVVRAMWSEPKANFDGRYYQIKDAFCAPKPVQKPHPPIWVGGNGPRIIELAARYGDGVNFTSASTPEIYAARLETLRDACGRVGRDYDTVRLSNFNGIVIGADEGKVEHQLRNVAQRFGTTVEEARGSYPFVGTADQAVEWYSRFIDLGVELFNVVVPFGREAESVQLMADKVLPKL